MNAIELLPSTTSDLDFALEAERDAENAPFILAWQPERHLAALDDPDQAHRTAWLGEHRVGFILLAGLASPNRCVEFRRILVTRKGAGIGRQLVQAVKRLAFDEYRAHRLWLDVKEDNQRARRLYRSEGFTEEGTLRECLLGPVGFESLVVMALLSEARSPASPRRRCRP